MNYIRHLNAFFSVIKADNRLTSTHVSLYLALFQYWNFNRFQNPFPVYRENIMQISKIGSKNTYHKCMKELKMAGYILHHPSASRFHPVHISIIRLDLKSPQSAYHQLALFPSPPNQQAPIEPDLCPSSGTGSGSNEGPNGTNSGTPAVPDPVRSIKQNNKPVNSVLYTPTKKLVVKKKEKAKRLHRAHVPNAVPAPLLSEVEAYFLQHNQDQKEAHNFFYYNQGKHWMLTGKLPITDWQALAQKWMLNKKSPNQKQQASVTNPVSIEHVQQLYEAFLTGENINKRILPEYADLLQFPITEEIRAEALQRRINQLSGSNENRISKLWQAYLHKQWNHELVIRDQPELQALTKRLTVLKFFLQCKNAGYVAIEPGKQYPIKANNSN